VTNAQGKVWSSEFDAHGYRTASLDPNSHTTQYAYDATGQLTAITNVLGQVQQYQYDPVNRMTNKTYLGAGDVTRFYYDDQWRLIAEYDGGGNLLAKYVYGPEIDEPVRMTRGGNDYYYHAAALGTVTEITDANGNVVERYTYDVYGEPQMWDASGSPIANSQIGNRLLFQGRDRDPATGLYNFRNRYYSPGLGRFVRVDPIRLQIWPNRDELGEPGFVSRRQVGEDIRLTGPNLYAFVRNDPVNRFDPLGLKDKKEEEEKSYWDWVKEMARRVKEAAEELEAGRCPKDPCKVPSSLNVLCTCMYEAAKKKSIEDMIECVCLTSADLECKRKAREAIKSVYSSK